MRKLVCIFLVLCMLLALPTAALAKGDGVELTLKTEQDGDRLTVKLMCVGNPGLSSVQLTLAFNKNVLKCTSCELMGRFSRMMAAENPNATGGAKIAAASATNITGDGLMATYEFDIVGSGDYGLGLKDVVLAMEDGTDVEYSFVGGESDEESETPAPGIPVVPEVPEAGEKLPFADMAGHWAEDYLVTGYDRGVLAGYPDGSCRPDENVTRAQFVTFLWRSVGEPKPSKPSDFTDLNPNATYYLDAVAWAQEKGYIIGVGDNMFLPANSISRQEVALILWRVAGGMSGGEMMFTDIYDKHFTDSANVSPWAKDAVYWAIYNEVWCGKGSVETGNILASRSAASRAEIVVMMVNYQDKFER